MEFVIILLLLVGVVVTVDQLLIKKGIFFDASWKDSRLKLIIYSLVLIALGFGFIIFGLGSVITSYSFSKSGVLQKAIVISDAKKIVRSRRNTTVEHDLTVEFKKLELSANDVTPTGVAIVRTHFSLLPGSYLQIYRIPYTDTCSTSNELDYSSVIAETLRVETPCTTISISARTNACSLRW